MVGRVVSLLLAFSLLLTQHSWADPATAQDPAQFDWKQCERLASCYVPGKCIGRIDGLLSVSRRPFNNCTVGIIMDIKSSDHIDLTVVTEVQAKTINLNWMALKPAYTCHATDTVEKSVPNSRSTATITRKITSHVGYTIDARNEMQFRVPDSSIDWAVCSDDDKACLVSGKCDGGRETQLRVSEDPKSTCKNGAIAKIISPTEWQITIYVEADGEIKNDVVLEWLPGMELFSCKTTNHDQEGASELFKLLISGLMPSGVKKDDFDIIRHIPYYDKAKNLIKCTFTILIYINESTQYIKEKSKKVLNFLFDDTYKNRNLEIKFTGYTDDIKTAMVHKMIFDLQVCVGCAKAKQTGDTVVYTPGPCELYTCANPLAKMNVNNRFMREEMLKCVNSQWKLKKIEKENGNEQFINIETLESVTCAEKYDCHQMYLLKSSCGSAPDTTCRKIDIAQRPFSPTCDKGFSLVFFPSKKTKRDPVNITSIRCDEKEGHWELFIDHTGRLVKNEGGTVVCIVDGYELPKFNALTGAQEPHRKEESNVALKVSLYALAVIFAIAIILIVAFFIITKIKTRQETPDDLPEGTPVIHPKPILTVHKMEAKRKVSLVVT